MLNADVDSTIIYEIQNPLAWQKAAKSIPIMIERPGFHGDGGHVLFMDGHVEFCLYPGKFPMTVDFIEGLQSLDLLDKYPNTRDIHFPD